jgi:hypothetical protein
LIGILVASSAASAPTAGGINDSTTTNCSKSSIDPTVATTGSAAAGTASVNTADHATDFGLHPR